MPRSRLAAVLLLALPGVVLAQSRPPGSSWIEAGGFYHHVSHDFGSWTGGYARAALAGARDVWYLDARVQHAFGDRGVYGALANVHDFSKSFYTQLGVGAGTGAFVLPELRLDGSLSLKLGAGKRLVVTAGGTFVDARLGYRDKAAFGSLTWYAAGSLLLEAGGRINWSDPGAVRSERVTGALTVGHAGRSTLTLRGSAGTEGYQLLSSSITLRKFRSQEAGLALRHWLGRRLGVSAGAEWYHNPFYTRAGGSLGLFRAW